MEIMKKGSKEGRKWLVADLKNDKELLKKLDNIYIKLYEARKVIIDGFLIFTRTQKKKEKRGKKMDIIKKGSKDSITSLELVEQINFFRKQDKNRAELKHKTLLEIIRDEFSEEIGQQKILPSSYKNSQNKEYPMFILTFNQAKQVLVRENKVVRKAVIKYIEELEKRVQYRLPQNYSEALRELLSQVETNERLESKIEEDRPKVVFAEALEVSKNSILVGELAKILKQNGVDIGQNRLFEYLRKRGYLCNRKGEMFNAPTQKSMDLKLMEIKKTPFVNADGSVRTTRTTKITGKGQSYFINKFKSELAGVR